MIYVPLSIEQSLLKFLALEHTGLTDGDLFQSDDDTTITRARTQAPACSLQMPVGRIVVGIADADRAFRYDRVAGPEQLLQQAPQ